MAGSTRKVGGNYRHTGVERVEDGANGTDGSTGGDCEEGDGDSVDSCVGDINGDGFVDSADLGLIIGSWGTANSLTDLDDDGLVDSADLGIVIGAWGPCD